jgi:hypothetical protein
MIEDSNAAFYIGLNQKSNFSQDIISLSIIAILDAIVDLPQEPLQIDVPTEAAATSSTLQDLQENQKGSSWRIAMSSTLSQWKKNLELVRQTKSFH